MTEPTRPATQATAKVVQNEKICWEMRKPANPSTTSLGMGILAFSNAIATNIAM